MVDMYEPIEAIEGLFEFELIIRVAEAILEEQEALDAAAETREKLERQDKHAGRLAKRKRDKGGEFRRLLELDPDKLTGLFLWLVHKGFFDEADALSRFAMRHVHHDEAFARDKWMAANIIVCGLRELAEEDASPPEAEK